VFYVILVSKLSGQYETRSEDPQAHV